MDLDLDRLERLGGEAEKPLHKGTPEALRECTEAKRAYRKAISEAMPEIVAIGRARMVYCKSLAEG